MIYGKRYREVVDKCFDIMIQNPHIFIHADVEDLNKEQERAKIF
jgi:hypothetical protein